MNPDAIDERRRRLLLAGLGLAALGPVRGAASAWGTGGLLVSGFYQGQGAGRRDWLVWTDAEGRTGGRLSLPARGHGLCQHPAKPGHVVLFARRPGDRLWEIDLAGGRIAREIAAGPGHHFYGHGVFSPDGGLLYTTENRYGDGAGMVRVRSGADYRVLGEFPSGGVGPHDIRWFGDGRTLVLANGGILTHPDRPREKLNLDTMDPNLAYLDAGSGRIIEVHRPPLRQLSIRHLALSGPDQVVAVAQYEGPRDRRPPLVLFHRRGEEPRWPSVDRDTLARMSHYTASVAVDSGSGTALVTSPKGNLVTLWDLRGDRLLTSLDLRSPYGAALDPIGGGFLVTGETGEVHRVDSRGVASPLASTTAGAWDNHLLWLGDQSQGGIADA